MQTQNSYDRSFLYENFMRRAFRTGRDFSKGIDGSHYQQLERISNGTSLIRTSYAKQMQKIKNYLSKGIQKVLKWKLTDQERSRIIFYASQIESTEYEDTLYVSIEGLINVTARFKE
ncbi:hypothetical protein DBR43_09660 [Pedobacter sp. KBW06]|uniref:hypothetical protein n=1 Tax=Pedobacter sp. KBW06 TaxID=2153359 RepID=UPI000F5A66F4|nr:hypothetical protein [Pedobacter sp. KBW06]RQO75593.1 hypothetical protein DBR43_09660 [Pedobacter sp. KBW06]